MIGFNRVAEWLAMALVASLVLGGAPVTGEGPGAQAGALPRAQQRPDAHLAQAEDEPDIEQAGESDGGDDEALDEGAPPAQDNGDDVELLDQGASPATVIVAPVDSTAAPAEAVAAPLVDSGASLATDSSSVYSAQAQPASTGPLLPPGFGSGRVRASAGRFGFPVGIEGCHVGAVTGRAYVGIDCEDGPDVVGHARSFDDFPFVLEAEFPFESDDAFFSDPFFTGGESRDRGENADDEVTSGRTTRSDTTENLVVTGIGTGNSTVELAQRGRDREPRIRTGKSAIESQTKRQKTKSENAKVASASNDDADSGKRAKARGAEKKQTSAKNKSKNKKSKGAKNNREKRRSGKKN